MYVGEDEEEAEADAPVDGPRFRIVDWSDGFKLGSANGPLGFEGSSSDRELGLEGSSSGSDHKMIGLNEKEAKVRFCGLAKETPVEK